MIRLDVDRVGPGAERRPRKFALSETRWIPHARLRPWKRSIRKTAEDTMGVGSSEGVRVSDECCSVRNRKMSGDPIDFSFFFFPPLQILQKITVRYCISWSTYTGRPLFGTEADRLGRWKSLGLETTAWGTRDALRERSLRQRTKESISVRRTRRLKADECPGSSRRSIPPLMANQTAHARLLGAFSLSQVICRNVSWSKGT